MRAHAIVEQIIPEIKPCYNFKQNNKYHAHDVYDHSLLVLNGCAGSSIEVMMAALLHDIGKPKSYVVDENGHGHFYGHPEVSYEIAQKVLEKDFKFTRKTNDEILTLIRNHDMTVASTKASVKRALNKFGEKTLKNWCILKQADMNDHVYVDFSKNNVTDVQYVENMIQEIMAEESCFNLKDLDIDGKIIMNSLGVKPGKHVGIILNTLLKEVIDERVINEQSVLIARAEEILREIQSE
jgi:tRNA nucleotidyltransferase (CCA-adding enzyme)